MKKRQRRGKRERKKRKPRKKKKRQKKAWKRKVEEREAKAEQVAKSKTINSKRNLANILLHLLMFIERGRVPGGAAYRETNSNTCCCVSFGQHKHDIDEETGCLVPEWIQCNNQECDV